MNKLKLENTIDLIITRNWSSDRDGIIQKLISLNHKSKSRFKRLNRLRSTVPSEEIDQIEKQCRKLFETIKRYNRSSEEFMTYDHCRSKIDTHILNTLKLSKWFTPFAEIRVLMYLDKILEETIELLEFKNKNPEQDYAMIDLGIIDYWYDFENNSIFEIIQIEESQIDRLRQINNYTFSNPIDFKVSVIKDHPNTKSLNYQFNRFSEKLSIIQSDLTILNSFIGSYSKIRVDLEDEYSKTNKTKEVEINRINNILSLLEDSVNRIDRIYIAEADFENYFYLLPYMLDEMKDIRKLIAAFNIAPVKADYEIYEATSQKLINKVMGLDKLFNI